MDTSIQVIIVDDHNILRNALVAFLEEEENISVIGEAGSGEEFLQQIAQGLQPDVALIDIELPRMSGIETTRQLQKMLPNLPVIGLSANDETSMITAMVEAGACGYVRKDSTVRELTSAIRAAYTKQFTSRPSLAEFPIFNPCVSNQCARMKL